MPGKEVESILVGLQDIEQKAALKGMDVGKSVERDRCVKHLEALWERINSDTVIYSYVKKRFLEEVKKTQEIILRGDK